MDIIEAYVFINTEVGRTAGITRTLAGMDGIKVADAVTGPYDVVVMIEGENTDQLGRLVVNKIQAISGITRTMTCPVTKL